MKIKCFYYDEDLRLPWANIIDIQNYNINYAKYLFNFIIHTNDRIEYLLENIEKIQKREEKLFERLVEIPDIYIYIYLEKTLFEHNQEHWEEWECPTIVVKKALEGWKKFLEMPRDKNTVYEFEIPDSDL
ncbi:MULTISPECIES: hypothetical protein [Fusobacterium]|uniref:hypothetical protein n=1 Tax=Fusobacterium TaxID=848 RepID=UPI0025BE8F99|nr:hypothetical protein [Fusobacterium sp.]MCI7223113.1 hypothetical protein [Fusobacterium sp.]MDD7391985.1 hypothetical protein [Fusobacteriaceae bacterium]MDD7410941.1 hypothetical protein [Fusobacteriaceae bacterium]MDY5714009.1 hypothetical protein [Fusobacterium gastrosuis]